MTVVYTAEQVNELLREARQRANATIAQLRAEAAEARDVATDARNAAHAWRMRAKAAEGMLAAWRQSAGGRMAAISGQTVAADETVVLRAVRHA